MVKTKTRSKNSSIDETRSARPPADTRPRTRWTGLRRTSRSPGSVVGCDTRRNLPCRTVELVVDLDRPVVGAGPPAGQVRQRRGLVERDRALAEQLDRREEAALDDDRRVGVRDEDP